MEIMKHFAGTCAPDATPECWEIFDVRRNEREHEQNRLNLVLSLDVACFLTAAVLITVYILLGKNERK